MMENIQVNGQRIWGPPSNWIGPPPPHGTEVYIKNVPEDIMENDLCQIFATIGVIYEVRVPVHWNGLNRGYAFVRYTKMEDASKAIKELNRLEIRVGWQIKVERSIDNNRLFLSAVPVDKTGDDILNDLKTVVENVKKVFVYPSLENPSLFRGYAFVEFNCHRDAAIAKRILTPDICYNLFEKKCIAAWANPLPYLHESILETINILFMRNIPNEMKTMTVKRLVEICIGAESIERVKRLNDIAFLTFKNHESAKKALEIIRGHPFFLGQSEVEVEWAVPRQLAYPKFSLQIPKETEKNTKDLMSQVVEISWKNRVQGMKCLNNVLMSDSNQNDWEIKLFESSNETENAVMQLAEDMKRKNFSPKDFINNNMISFKNVIIDEGLNAQESEETCRLLHLQYWFEKLIYCCDCSSPLTISSTDSLTQFDKKNKECNPLFIEPKFSNNYLKYSKSFKKM